MGTDLIQVSVDILPDSLGVFAVYNKNAHLKRDLCVCVFVCRCILIFDDKDHLERDINVCVCVCVCTEPTPSPMSTLVFCSLGTLRTISDRRSATLCGVSLEISPSAIAVTKRLTGK